jgi:hypothetical protein
MVEKIRIEPDRIVIKDSFGNISYAAGISDTGIPYPAYLRSMNSYEVNATYANTSQVYYNQLAPTIYPIDNVNFPVTALPTCAGHIYKILPATNTVGAKISESSLDIGVYLMVPTLLYTQNGSLSSYGNLVVTNKLVSLNAYTFGNVSVNVVRLTFNNGAIGWYGPCDTAGNLIYVACNSSLYSASYKLTSKIGTDAKDTVQAAYAASEAYTSNVYLYQNTAPFSGTGGIIKILFYSRGSQKLRFTK